MKGIDLRSVSFDDAFVRVGINGKKLQTMDYRDSGMYPVVDQSQALIAAFTDDEGLLQSPPSDGFIVFGDHTRTVKFINFRFVVGADGVQLLRSREGFDARYLAHCLRMSDIPNTGYNRHFKFLKDLSFNCPLLPEQRAIAEALSDADALVESLDALIAKKRDMKHAAMQQLLTGRTRLPGFSGEWQELRIGDVGRCLRGVSYNPQRDLSDRDTETTVRLLRSNNVQQSLLSFDDVQFVEEVRVSEEQILIPGDVVVCMANGSRALVGKSGLFRGNDEVRHTFGAFMGCFRTDAAKAAPGFVRFLFLTKRYLDYISNLLAGSAINNLAPSSIESLRFDMPPLAEQQAIAEILSDMDSEIDALVARREKAELVKQGMMQELLSGRVRLV